VHLTVHGVRNPHGRTSLNLSSCRAWARFGVLFAWTAWCVTWAGCVEWFTPNARRAALWNRHKRRWCRGLFFIFGIELRVCDAAGNDRPLPHGRDHTPTVGTDDTGVGGGALIVANHRSPMDVAILLYLMDGHFMSRADLARWPVIGRAAKRVGTIFVDRTHSSQGAAAIRSAARMLNEGKRVIVFPEGTTHAEGDELLPFRSGAFVALQGTHGRMVPVGLAYPAGAEFREPTFHEHVLRMARRTRMVVGVCIGEPLASRGNADTDRHLAREMIQSLVHTARVHAQRVPTHR
jgi:1-acyl-sn-glycerol-3-phosphate acyltransferase